MKIPRLLLCLAAATAVALPLAADEGMWMPQQMTLPGHAKLQSHGRRDRPAKLLADPLAAHSTRSCRSAGCSASFVSPEGLIVTNHHCVQGALQFNSTPQRNLVENGFLAKTREEELSTAPARASSSRSP